MKRYITPVVVVLMIMVTASGLAAGLFEPEELDVPQESENPVDLSTSRTYTARIVGVIRLVGNEPFTHLVITTEDGLDYILDEVSRKQYHDLQGSRVIAHGEVRESPVYAGRTTLIGTHRLLTVVDLKSTS